MAEEIANSTTAAPAASSATPVVEAAPPTGVTPAAESTVTPDSSKPESTPSAEPVKTEEPAKPEAKVPEVKADTLLGGEKKSEVKADDKPAEETKSEDKPAETKEGETKEPEIKLPEYEPFKLPEDVKFDSEKMGEFTKALAEFETTTKASHEEVQKFGQSLIDRHVAEVNSTLERYTQSLTDAWNKQKTDWKDAFIKDPEFANRTDTVVNAAIDAIGIYGGDSKQQQEFRELMESTGIGNHPAMIRLLSNIMLAKAEPKPLAAPMIAPKSGNSKLEKMYGKRA